MSIGTVNLTIIGGVGIPTISIKSDVDNIERYISDSYVNGEASFNSICDGIFHEYTVTISQNGFLSDSKSFSCKCDPDQIPENLDNCIMSIVISQVDPGYRNVQINLKYNVSQDTFFYFNTEEGTKTIVVSENSNTITSELPGLFSSPSYINNSSNIPKCACTCAEYLVGANNGGWELNYSNCLDESENSIFNTSGDLYTFCACLDSVTLTSPEENQAYVGVNNTSCNYINCIEQANCLGTGDSENDTFRVKLKYSANQNIYFNLSNGSILTVNTGSSIGLLNTNISNGCPTILNNSLNLIYCNT